ncbi:MAG: YraN family protein [Gammaproteobacteria bacterium]|nr:MAG: YraN family protein [Gammaproteobacteria bacterium]
MSTKRKQGEQAESAAEHWLNERGLRPVARNYRCRGGEVDLIMRHDETLVFVEVRLRRHHTFGGALASVDRRKQHRLILAAQHYLQHHSWEGPCRFDVVGLDARGVADWVQDAFGTG